ncbi:ATP-dependent metallopeptidase FtsH/Yme1/Tma family protein, partial [Acinetobacter pittii]
MKESMQPRQQRFSLWYAVIVALTMLAFQTLFMSEQVDTLPYSDFKALLHAGKIKDVAIGDQD